ncbi:hypothetical protein SAY86_016682 [Trapa natans]|uniref:Germin-like protein n=1 Tax=Trapa natans TaxID=22666 RepID=A0AAN7LCN8_TRANT|nr:hypothetical protein SAY86_016682 [Trapa natans]
MATTSSLLLLLPVIYPITFLFLILLPCHASDPDPLQDFCVADLKSTISINGFPCKPVSAVTSSDFFFDGFTREGNTDGPFSWRLTPGNVLSFPALNTLGISMNRLDFAPGGMNPPHSHPRASEAGVVIQGKLLVGFITTENVFYSKVLGPGEMFVVPRGLVHFQKNVGKGKALAFTAFNSHLAGSVVAAPNLFGATPAVPNDVLTQAFRINNNTVNLIKSKFKS